MTDTDDNFDEKLPGKDGGTNDFKGKRRYRRIERVLRCPWDALNDPYMPLVNKEVWRADPSTWLDLETSSFSWLPVDILRVHILPLLSYYDLTLFLLSLGFNQYTNGFHSSYRIYDAIAPLPKWLSNWLWENRKDTHTYLAHRFTGWDSTGGYGDWVCVRNRITFDGDDPPEVYKKRWMERGDRW